MGKPTGFMEYQRVKPPRRPVGERLKDHREVDSFLPEESLRNQTARCMDCGIPYCHMYGCPVRNRIPDFNEMVYRGKWRRALDILHSTNNFPEITGRVCPATCEAACTLSINSDPVLIRHIELQIAEKGWNEGWILPEISPEKSSKRVAVVGSGPAGLAAAQQLARLGHQVVVFEKSDRIGGLLRYGIPDFKLEKEILDRRLEQIRAEGVVFETGVEVGEDISVQYLSRMFSAILIATGAGAPRDLNVPGRDLTGIHFAVDYLTQQNRSNAGEIILPGEEINAYGKDVVVIGGGDTGSDCVGTALRHGAKSVTQIEILPKPALERPESNPWPTWPLILRTSSSHEEGGERLWSVMTKEFLGDRGYVKKLKCVRLEWYHDENGRNSFREVHGSEFTINATLVLLSLGFLHVEHGNIIESSGLELDERGNIKTDTSHMTSVQGIFSAGDSLSGASLVVRAIDSGRSSAMAIDRYLCSL